jgi:serine O-acetyltransferase
VGVPGRVVRRDNQALPRENLDHGHLPDPVFDDIASLKRENIALTSHIVELEKALKTLEQKVEQS